MSEDDFYKTIGYDPDTKRPIGDADPFAEPPKAPKRPAPKKEPQFIEVTTHKFKSNIAHYIRECEAGRIKGVILKRYNQNVGFYAPWKP